MISLSLFESCDVTNDIAYLLIRYFIRVIIVYRIRHFLISFTIFGLMYKLTSRYDFQREKKFPKHAANTKVYFIANTKRKKNRTHVSAIYGFINNVQDWDLKTKRKERLCWGAGGRKLHPQQAFFLDRLLLFCHFSPTHVELKTL